MLKQMAKTALSGVLGSTARLALNNRRMNFAVMQEVAKTGAVMLRKNADHLIAFRPDDLIGSIILKHGEFQRGTMRAAVTLLKKKRALAKGGTFFEIGANIGTHTVYASLEHGFDNYVCLEPDTRTIGILETNIRLNGLTEKSLCLPVAASNFNGELSFTQDGENLGGSHVARKGEAGTVTIDCRRVDDILTECGASPESVSLVWIDVEGHEAGVFEGMPGLLKAAPPVVFEYSAHLLGTTQKSTLADLVFGAYRNVYLLENEPAPISKSEFMYLPRQVDIIAFGAN